MKPNVVWLLLVALVGLSSGEKSVDDLIKEVFNVDPPTPQVDPGNNPQYTTPHPKQVSPKEPEFPGPDPVDGSLGGNDCECVPYYQCKNDSIITDGAGLLDIRRPAGSPCQASLDVCCGTGNQFEPNEQPVTPKPKGRTGCGMRNTDGVGFRITGNVDNEAQFGEFPWMVALLRVEDVNGEKISVYKCGGALIHQNVVMTAAHCVVGTDPHTFKARAGEWDTQTSDELLPYQDRWVRQVIVHENYYPGGLYNDIALLIMEEPFVFADNIDVVCLPRQDDVILHNSCWASGWGKDVFGKQGNYQVILKRVELPMVPRDSCQKSLRGTRLGTRFRLHDSFVCAGGIPGKDTCKGDGGSPLICPIKGKSFQYQQVGIVAWGIGCGGETPAAYVNVAKFRNWIDYHLQKLGFETEYNYSPLPTLENTIESCKTCRYTEYLYVHCINNEQRSRGFSLNICRVVSETSHLCLRHVPCLKGSRRLQYLPVAASVKWIKEMRAATIFVLFLMVTTISGQKKCQCVEYNRCADADSNGVQWIDLTKRSCTNSLEICCDDVLQSPTTIERGSPSKKVCGQRNAQGFTFRVKGDEGNEAQFAEFPWMVMILEEVPLGGERTKVYECGGSLIHPSVVMTAAHCVSKKNPRNLIVRAGDWDHQTTKEPSPHQDRYVSQVIVHEKFNSDSLVHDVALIVVNDPFKFADNVQLACLPRPDEQSFDQGCMATGWGQGETGKYQVILKRVDLPIVDRMTCEKKMRATELGPAFRLHDSFICAGGIPDKDTCTGDGGSPLVCPIRGKPSRYQQVGIVSWGIKCGTTVPAAYANVAHVRSWIDNQMKRLKFNTDYDY